MSDLDLIAQIDEKIHQLPRNVTIRLNEYIDFLLQQNHAETESQPSTFWQEVQSLRATIDFEVVGDVDEIFNSVRDRQVGREIEPL